MGKELTHDFIDLQIEIVNPEYLAKLTENLSVFRAMFSVVHLNGKHSRFLNYNAVYSIDFLAN